MNRYKLTIKQTIFIKKQNTETCTQYGENSYPHQRVVGLGLERQPIRVREIIQEIEK